MTHSRTGFLGRLACSLGAAILPLVCAVAFAQTDAKVDFDMPAQSLESALQQVARTQRVQILFSEIDVKTVPAPAVKGRLTAFEAVQKLIEGTDLVAVANQSNAIAIRPKSPNMRGGPAANPTLLAQAQSETDRAGASDPGTRKPERVEVTGSRIPGVADGPSPLQIYSRKDIEDSGAATVAEFVRKLPQNFNSAAPETLGFTAVGATVGNQDFGFAAGVNLRGIGADSTLVLLNGRRLATSGGTAGAIVDLSTIPVAAIERIEVLLDGASAIYGADALGGVVNIILRRQFDGGQVQVRYGNDTKGRETSEQAANVVFGVSGARARGMVGLDYLEKGDLNYGDRDVTRSFDKRPFGGRDTRSLFQATPGNVRAVDNFLNALNRPTSATNWVAIPSGQDGTRLTISQFNSAAPANLGPTYFSSTLSPGERRKSAFGTGEYWFNGSLRVFADALYSDRTLQYTQSAPIVTGATVAANHPFNPFGEAVIVAYSFIPEFPRGLPFARANKSILVTAGAAGALPILRGDWSWEIAATTSTDDFSGNVVTFPTALVTEALAILDPARALNLFGDQGRNNPETIASLYRYALVRGKATTDSVLARVDGPLYALPAGEARGAFGFESRREKLSFFSEITNDSSAGERDVNAAFAEVLVPVMKRADAAPFDRLDLTVAGRAEDYSDFGRSNNPKVGLVLAGKEILLRASWGKSFKAPLLRETNRTGSLITTALSDINAPGGTRTVSVPVLSNNGNANLDPETADIWSVGAKAEFAPAPRMRVTVEASYFDIGFQDRIVQLSTTGLFGLERQGVLPPGVVNRDAAGNLVSVALGPINFARLDISGVDASLNASCRTEAGTFLLNFAGTRYRRYLSQIQPGQPFLDVLDHIGWPGTWSARATLGWSWRGFTAAVSGFTSSSYLQDLDPVVPGVPDRIPGWKTVDVNASYDMPKSASRLGGLRIAAGVINVTDRDAPFVQGLLGYDPSRSNVRGRSYYVQLSKSF